MKVSWNYSEMNTKFPWNCLDSSVTWLTSTNNFRAFALGTGLPISSTFLTCCFQKGMRSTHMELLDKALQTEVIELKFFSSMLKMVHTWHSYLVVCIYVNDICTWFTAIDTTGCWKRHERHIHINTFDFKKKIGDAQRTIASRTCNLHFFKHLLWFWDLWRHFLKILMLHSAQAKAWLSAFCAVSKKVLLGPFSSI